MSILELLGKFFSLLKTVFFIQAICFLITLPILYFWQIPICTAAWFCNIVFAPIMIAFLAFSLLFCLSGPVWPKIFCDCFSGFVTKWLALMNYFKVDYLVHGGRGLILAWTGGVLFLLVLYFFCRKFVRPAIYVLCFGLHFLALSKGQGKPKDSFELVSRCGKIEFYKTKNLIVARDSGFLAQQNRSFVVQGIRRELFAHFKSGKLNKLHLTRVSNAVLKNVEILALLTDLEEVSLDRRLKKAVPVRVLSNYIGRLKKLRLKSSSVLPDRAC